MSRPTRRSVTRKSKGTKLYAVRDGKGNFKDIVTYKRARAHSAALKAQSRKAGRVRVQPDSSVPRKRMPRIAAAQFKRGACEIARRKCRSWDSKGARCSRRDCDYYKPFHHPDDITIGKRVHWKRGAEVMTGYVTRVLDDQFRPGRVRCNGRSYTPHIDDYCHEDEGLGVKLMQSHSPAMLAGLAAHRAIIEKPVTHNKRVRKAFIGVHVSAARRAARKQRGTESVPIMEDDVADKKTLIDPEKLAAYNVRDGGIYLREFNVRLATFQPNSHHLQMSLRELFDTAATLRTRGWHTCQCGQWVHDNLCPCTVCSKPRLRAKIVKRAK